jgi:alpha-amylase/alpha-mannosidase (GH57 family)
MRQTTSDTNKYLCIHGHFYQPPRENPWLGAIEYEASARPYHDWNNRITRECYGPNTRARIHDKSGHILKLLNNYVYMSFNFGPTLLSWLEKAHPWVYKQILAADKASRDRYHGHGNALAQVYNHIIMPLAHRRDKLTQIRWGLADFKQRFGRKAEGMWLAETAVDTETLELMIQEGIKFTILSPTQAQSIRPLTMAGEPKESDWEDVSGGRINPTRAYRVWLDKSAQHFIDVFFYTGPLSRAVAYEKILASGENFLSRIQQAFGEHQDEPQLVSVVTDGESYGHHFKFGDLALSWLFDQLEETGRIKLTNFALFLECFSPKYEVKLFENSSWSCSHGVDRWRADCGCSVDHTPGWNQAWRAPLREGLDWLSHELETIFEEQGKRLLKDPYKARDDYVTVFTNPSCQGRERFFQHHASHRLATDDKIETLRLMESQRMSLYMFTSCGWFFDDISGLEAAQVLKYAARAIYLVRPWAKRDLEERLMGFLSRAKSNDQVYGDGVRVYQRLVEPSRINPSVATAHYALHTLAGVHPKETCVFSQMVRSVWKRDLGGHHLHVALGEAQVSEKVTGQEFRRIYIARRSGARELICLVGESVTKLDPEQIVRELEPLIASAAPEKIEAVFSRHLRQVKSYEFQDLIPDIRKCLVQGLARNVYWQIKDSILKHEEALREFVLFVEHTGESVPQTLGNVFSLLISDKLAGLMISGQEEAPTDWKGLRRCVKLASRMEFTLRDPELTKKAQKLLLREMEKLTLLGNPDAMKKVISFLNMVEELHLELDLWECQNMFYDLYKDQRFIQRLSPKASSTFRALGERLGFQLGED